MSIAVVLLAIMICPVITGSAGYVIYMQSRPGDPFPQPEPEAHVQSGTLDDPAGRKAALDALVAEGILTPSINATPSMENGKGMANLMVENPPDDGNYFVVTAIHEDTGEELFRPGYLDPERYIEEVPPDVELEAGEYACVVNFNAYRIQDNAYVGRGTTCITPYVKN